MKETGAIVRGNARFTLLSDGLVRLEYAPDGRFEERRSVRAAARSEPVSFASVTERAGWIFLRTRRFVVRHRPDGRPFSARNLQVCDARTGRRLWAPGQVDRRNLGGAHTSLDVMHRCWIPRGVHPAGTAYHPNGKNGELWNFLLGPDGETWNAGIFDGMPLDHVFATCPERVPDFVRRLFRERAKYPPGLLSRAGYFLFNDSGSAVRGPDGWSVPRGDAGHLDYYLFVYGRDFTAALGDYRRLFGSVPVPPRYALGLWYSRYPTLDEAGLRAVALDFERHDLPLDVLILDLEWHRHGWSGFDWNIGHIRNPEGLLRWLHARDTRVGMNVHPGGQPAEDSRTPAFRKAAGIPADGGSYDFALRRHAAAYLDILMRPVMDQGVDLWWIDGNAPVRATPGLEKAFWSNEVFGSDMDRNRPDRRPMTFCRSAGLGSHRHPYHFTGDTFSQWEVLESQVEYTLRAGHIGLSLITHDIGGFINPFHTLDPALFLRWVQWGVMSPLFRLHGAFGGERRPWFYGDKFLEGFRRAIGLRMELLPYLYSMLRVGHETGLPLCRSNALAFPDWERGYGIWDAYALGDRLYATPVVRPGDLRPVCLPPGRWYDAVTSKWIESDGWRSFNHIVQIDRDPPPYFVRAGSVLVRQPYAHRAAHLPETLVVELYPARRRSRDTFELHEDDGHTREHERGARAMTRFELVEEKDRLTLVIHPAEGRYAGQPTRRTFDVRAFDGDRWRWRVDGRPVEPLLPAAGQGRSGDIAEALTGGAGAKGSTKAAPYSAIRLADVASDATVTIEARRIAAR